MLKRTSLLRAELSNLTRYTLFVVDNKVEFSGIYEGRGAAATTGFLDGSGVLDLEGSGALDLEACTVSAASFDSEALELHA